MAKRERTVQGNDGAQICQTMTFMFDIYIYIYIYTYILERATVVVETGPASGDSQACTKALFYEIEESWVCCIWRYFDVILPNEPYPPFLRMADRALLAGYPWIEFDPKSCCLDICIFQLYLGYKASQYIEQIIAHNDIT